MDNAKLVKVIKFYKVHIQSFSVSVILFYFYVDFIL